MDTLTEIVAARKKAVAVAKESTSVDELKHKVKAYEREYGKPLSIVDKIRQVYILVSEIYITRDIYMYILMLSVGVQTIFIRVHTVYCSFIHSSSYDSAPLD
jgi:hypothetical protein